VTTVTFYSGVGQIGGNMIHLVDGSTAVFLDFGKNYKGEGQFFDEPYLRPREEKHLLGLGLLPSIDGLYKKDERDAHLDAIVLSHAHTDHTDYIRYVKDHVPVYSSQVTRDVMVAREWSSPGGASTEYKIASLTKTRGEEISKELRILPLDGPAEIGSLQIEALSVDHSAPGACGLIVHSQASDPVVYTGDFRWHGRRGEETQRFIQRAAEVKPGALIIEGTNIVSGRPSTEEEVREKIESLVSAVPKLVLAGFSAIDADRMRTFYEVARATGRRLALSMKQVFLLLNLGAAAPFGLDDPLVLAFRREKKTEYLWESRVEETGVTVVTNEDIRSMQELVILVASFYDMNEMVDIQPQPGSVYILSQSEPFNEEMEIDFDKLLNWLERWGIPLYNIHASGHCLPLDLKETIRRIGAGKVFLIHTEKPALYKQYLQDLPGAEIICPLVGEQYHI